MDFPAHRSGIVAADQGLPLDQRPVRLARLESADAHHRRHPLQRGEELGLFPFFEPA